MSEIPQTEAVINRLKLLEASKNLDEKMTSLSQEVARLKKKIEEEYEENLFCTGSNDKILVVVLKLLNIPIA
jgi:regulator of replication initiation timing